MPTDVVRRAFRNLQAEQESREENRFVDLAVSWEDASGKEISLFGGQWDQIEQRYTGRTPERCAVIRFTPAQMSFVAWAAWWMQERREGRARDFLSLFAIGDRGGGKTFSAVAILGTLQVEFPRLAGTPSIARAVSRSHTDRAELDRYFKALFPATWYHYREWPWHTYHWVTGATLENASAEALEGLRAKGRVDFVLINEAGVLGKGVPFTAIPRIKDSGGLAIITANPPTTTKAQWILDLAEKAKDRAAKGEPYHTKFVRIKSAGNTTIDHAVADQVAELLHDLDPRAAKADGDGELLPIGERSYFAWRKQTHFCESPPAHLRDITRAYTQQRYGRPYDYIGGLDFQGSPHHAAVVCKVFGTIADPTVVVVDECVAEESTEDDLIDMAEEAGYSPETILWIADASGQWQDGKHKSGRDSFGCFKARRYAILPPALKKTDKGRFAKNPPVEKRVGLVNKMLGKVIASGTIEANVVTFSQLPPDPSTVRLYVQTEAPRLGKALQECPSEQRRFGRRPVGYYAHITDALGYVCWWVAPAARPVLQSNAPLAISVGGLTTP